MSLGSTMESELQQSTIVASRIAARLTYLGVRLLNSIASQEARNLISTPLCMNHCNYLPRGDQSLGSLNMADNYETWNMGYGIHINLKDGMDNHQQSACWVVQFGWLNPLTTWVRLDRLDLTVGRVVTERHERPKEEI